jgi:hypothetical protein
MSKTHSTSAAKPSKPYLDFPLFSHARNAGPRRSRGRCTISALDNYDKQKDALHAGRKPRPDADCLTVKDVANDFLKAKQSLVDTGDLESVPKVPLLRYSGGEGLG